MTGVVTKTAAGPAVVVGVGGVGLVVMVVVRRVLMGRRRRWRVVVGVVGLVVVEVVRRGRRQVRWVGIDEAVEVMT